MSQLKSIQLAIELATRKRDACAKAVAQALRTADFSKNQMAQLEGYAGDTDVRWMQGGSSTPLSGELIHHHYSFMDRLQQAIALQRDVLTNTGLEVQQAQHALLQAEFRLAGLNHILKARQTAHQVQQQRREQRQTDEFAGMLHARTQAQSMTGEFR
jgi:flagellar FliJ protein